MSSFKEKVGNRREEFIAAMQRNIGSYEKDIAEMDAVLDQIKLTGKAVIYGTEYTWPFRLRKSLAFFVREAFQSEKRKRYDKCIRRLKQKINELSRNPKEEKRLSDWDIDRARQVSCEEILLNHGYEVKRGQMVCFDHKDKNPSMHVYKGNVHCFACGAHYDSIALQQKLSGQTFAEAVKTLANVL